MRDFWFKAKPSDPAFGIWLRGYESVSKDLMRRSSNKRAKPRPRPSGEMVDESGEELCGSDRVC
jgi:hypothetical protein